VKAMLRRRRGSFAAVTCLLALLAATLQILNTADAAFTKTTASSGNTLGASSNFYAGALQRWGMNTVPTQTPVQMGSDTAWSVLAVGREHSCGIKTDSTLWCWGGNANGELGLSAADVASHGPTQVGSATWTAVAGGGGYTCGIQTTGTLWCWGDNSQGQLGTGNNTAYASPRQVGAGTN
jgi:alpha-tubulin suppressor-like RCC1 family protein